MTRVSRIQQIKAAVRIEAIIQQRGLVLTPHQSGERLTGHCPFHQQDRTPSFNVYLSTQRYHCFGCGANGDVIDFVEQFDGCSRREAMARLSATPAPPIDLAARRQTPRLLPPPEAAEQQHRHTEQLKPTPPMDSNLLCRVAQCYHRALLATPAISTCLRQQRGITLEGMMRCRLGYTDGTVLATSGLPAVQQAAAQTMGLLTASGTERMSHRVILPEYAADGTCTWMIGRIMPREKGVRSAFPPITSHKYLGLSLPKPLLGYGAAWQRIQARNLQPLYAIVVVEGAIDYVLLRQWDLPILPVALVGTHASFTQFSLLLDLQQEAGGIPILLCLDADEAGRQGSARLLARLAMRGRSVGVMPMVAQAKDIGDLGLRPDGRALVLYHVQQALASLVQGGQP